MNAFTDFGSVLTDDNGTVTVTHDDITDVSLFADQGSVIKAPLFDAHGRELSNYFGLANTVTGELLDSPPVSKGYKIVDHAKAFEAQARTILGNPELPHSNFTVVDKIIRGGRKATRAIFFNDLTWDIDGRGQGVTARADLINSIDMSSAFQIFAGAYREYCENTCVFGGAKTYHQKQKHTRNLSPEALIAKATLSMSMFDQHREQMKAWKVIDLHPSQWVELMEQTLCANTGKGRALATDKAVKVNGKLLDYMVHRFEQESKGLGNTAWAGYNALTHWATHTDESFERVREDGTVVELQTSRKGSNRDLVQLERNEKVRKVLDSDQWLALEGVAA
jgi:hypothetical protein